jgi:hypothetical protein
MPDDIQRFVFFPWVGILLLTIGTLRTIKKSEVVTLGEKKIWIPLAIICGSIALSGVEAFLEKRMVFQEMFSAIAIGILLFAVYVASRQLGDKIFRWMPIVVIIESVSVVIVSGINGWIPTGGIYSIYNYDIATGLLVFALLTSPVKHQWWLSAFAVVGLFFTGSAEAIFVGFVILVMALIRRDWGLKMVLPSGALALAVLVTTLTGAIWTIQAPTLQRLHLVQDMAKGEDTLSLVQDNPYLKPVSPNDKLSSTMENLDRALGFRISHSQLTIPIKPFGYGINLTRFYWGIPHNVILIIIEQVGILAALAWVFVMFTQAYKSPLKYAIVGFIALGVFDHFVFTQAAPLMPLLVGVSSVSTIKLDYIFKKGVKE